MGSIWFIWYRQIYELIKIIPWITTQAAFVAAQELSPGVLQHADMFANKICTLYQEIGDLSACLAFPN